MVQDITAHHDRVPLRGVPTDRHDHGHLEGAGGGTRCGAVYRAAAFPQVHIGHDGLSGRLAALARLTPEAPIVADAGVERAAILEQTMAVQRQWDTIVWTDDDRTRARLWLQMQQLRFDRSRLESQVNVALRSARAASTRAP